MSMANLNNMRNTCMFGHILGKESMKSERQLIDEYLEKRSKELFGEGYKSNVESYW